MTGEGRLAAGAGRPAATGVPSGYEMRVSPASTGCAGQPPVSSLPVWARGGFTPPDLAMPHVLGATGDIVAILWATRDALHAPPLPDTANKILWGCRGSPGPGR